MSENLMCPDHKGKSKKYLDNYDAIFGKKKKKKSLKKKKDK